MPEIRIVFNEEEYKKLQDDYQQMALAWPQLGSNLLLPTFEQWLALRAVTGSSPVVPTGSLDDLRVFHAIEKLITSFQPHGFSLAYLAKHEVASSASALELAEVLVNDFKLPQHYTKRLQDLFEYYLKSAKTIADIAHVGITNRAYGSLNEAYTELVERTYKALDHLDEERAVGRIEGAIAILVSVHALARGSAKEKAEVFKLEVHNLKKSTWVDKVFGGLGDEN